MIEWLSLSKEEKERSRDGTTYYDRRKIMDDRFQTVMELLDGDPVATTIARKMTWGNYFINTAEEIADYCRRKREEVERDDESRTPGQA